MAPHDDARLTFAAAPEAALAASRRRDELAPRFAHRSSCLEATATTAGLAAPLVGVHRARARPSGGRSLAHQELSQRLGSAGHRRVVTWTLVGADTEQVASGTAAVFRRDDPVLLTGGISSSRRLRRRHRLIENDPSPLSTCHSAGSVACHSTPGPGRPSGQA